MSLNPNELSKKIALAIKSDEGSMKHLMAVARHWVAAYELAETHKNEDDTIHNEFAEAAYSAEIVFVTTFALMCDNHPQIKRHL